MVMLSRVNGWTDFPNYFFVREEKDFMKENKYKVGNINSHAGKAAGCS